MDSDFYFKKRGEKSDKSLILCLSNVSKKGSNYWHCPFETRNNNVKQIDVVMGIPVFGNEVGAWIANKKNASFVHFFSVPFILPWVATSVGTPINPSYMPTPFLPFGQKMSFRVCFVFKSMFSYTKYIPSQQSENRIL